MKSNAMDAMMEKKVMGARPGMQRSKSVRYQSNSLLPAASDDSGESDVDSVSDISLDSAFQRDDGSITDESDEETVIDRQQSFRNSDPTFSQNMVVKAVKKEKKKKGSKSKQSRKALTLEDINPKDKSSFMDFNRDTFRKFNTKLATSANGEPIKSAMKGVGSDDDDFSSGSFRKAREFEDYQQELSGHNRDLDFDVSTQGGSFLTGDDDMISSSKKKKKKKKSKKSKKRQILNDSSEVDWEAVDEAKKDISQGRRYSVDEGNVYPELSKGETKQFKNSGNKWLEGKYSTSADWRRDATGLTLQIPTPVAKKEKLNPQNDTPVSFPAMLGLDPPKGSDDHEDDFDEQNYPHSTQTARRRLGSTDSFEQQQTPAQSVTPSKPDASSSKQSRRSSRKEKDRVGRRRSGTKQPALFPTRPTTPDSEVDLMMQRKVPPTTTPETEKELMMQRKVPPVTATPETEKELLVRRNLGAIPVTPVISQTAAAAPQSRMTMDTPGAQSTATAMTEASPGNGVNYFVLKIPTKKLSMHQRRNSLGKPSIPRPPESNQNPSVRKQEDAASGRMSKSDQEDDIMGTSKGRHKGRSRRRSSSVGARTTSPRQIRRSSSLESPKISVQIPLNDVSTAASVISESTKKSKRKSRRRGSTGRNSIKSYGTSDESSVDRRRRRAPSVTRSDDGLDIRGKGDKKSRKKDRRRSGTDKSSSGGRRRRSSSVPRSSSMEDGPLSKPVIRPPTRRRSLNINGEIISSGGGDNASLLNEPPPTPVRRKNESHQYLSFNKRPDVTPQQSVTEPRRMGFLSRFTGLQSEVAGTSTPRGDVQGATPPPPPMRGGLSRAESERFATLRDRGIGTASLTFNGNAAPVASRKYTPTQSKVDDTGSAQKSKQSYSEMVMEGRIGISSSPRDSSS